MSPSRYELSDLQWEQIKDFLPGRKEYVGRTAADNRLFVNGVLWVLRSGARWADLPERYGKYKSVHKRFVRWANSGYPSGQSHSFHRSDCMLKWRHARYERGC